MPSFPLLVYPDQRPRAAAATRINASTSSSFSGVGRAPLPLFGRGRFSQKSGGEREDAPVGLMVKFQEGGRKRKGIPEEKEEEEEEEVEEEEET